MKVTDIWKSKNKPTVSFEFYPAKTSKQVENLSKTIDVLPELKPDFVSVTFGAGGSTKEGSYQLLKKLKKEKNLEVIGYFACYGLGPDEILSVLDSYREMDIENILAVRGDPPPNNAEFTPHPQSMLHATNLITFIKQKYNFCTGAAGYPEGHIECEDMNKDLDYLKLKVDNGAEYIICNYFYDNNYFFKFIEQCRKRGINVPIIPGVMPIYSIKMMKTLAGICGATITDKVQHDLNALPKDDKKSILNFGIQFATKQCTELIKAGVPGLHFYTMNRCASIKEILFRLRNDGLL